MRRIWVMALCAALLPVIPSRGQVNATGTISGQVTDPSGASVAGATVKITEQTTGISVMKTTGTDGYYTAPLLKPGVYSIQVTANGFSGATRKDLTLQIQQVIQQDFHLQVGQVQQEVTVSGGAPLLNTESTELGNVISQDATQQLPLNGRNFSQLGLLVPGVNSGEVGGIRQSGGGNETQRAGAEIIADGGRGSFNLFMIDGLDDRDQSVGTVKVFPNLESIQEFKVQIGNYDAEFASGGAVVNVITRSGTNEIHGSAFEFLRNNDLDARQFFDASIPPYVYNQFGAAVGGPIIKNKTFFFADYQGLRQHQSSSSIASEPTEAMRNGDFSAYPATIYDPNTYNAATNERLPFPNNSIPSTRFNPIALNLLQVMPLPNLPGVTNNLRTNPLIATQQDQWDGRVDHTFSEKDTMFVRFTDGQADITYPNTPAEINGKLNPLAFVGSSLRVNHAPSMQSTVQEIHSFSPALVNQLALGYTRFYLEVTPIDDGNYTSEKLGLLGSDTTAAASGLASIGISGETGFSSSSVPEIVPQNTWQLSDTVSYTHGAHEFKFGFSAVHNAFSFFQISTAAGGLSFSGAYTNNPADSSGTGAGFADFLLGSPVSSSKGSLTQGTPYVSYTEYGGFAQDQWRVTNRLTLNLGLRYDVFTPPTERYDRLSDFVPGTGAIALAGQDGYSSSILQLQKHDFSPRVGLAYRIGDKTVMRMAYGMYYFNEQGTGGSARLFLGYPFLQLFGTNCSTTTPCLDLTNGIPSVPSTVNLPTAVYQPEENLTPNVQQWNYTIEHQLTPSLVLRGSYVGSRGTHLNIAVNENVATPGPGAVAPRQPYPQYSQISSWEDRGVSSYNGLQLSAEKRMSGGLSFIAAYTYSKSLDMGGGGNSNSSESRLNVQNPRNIAAEYGLSDFNFGQRFTFSAIYQLPFGRGKKFASGASRLVNTLVGGWQISSILTLQSGGPFTVNMASSTSNTGTFQRPDRVCNGNLPTSQQSIDHWFDTSCFVAPAQYTFGNAGRDILTGPGLETWDFSADKDFLLTERFGLQFRSEFFNALNHANFDDPDGSIGSPSAGIISDVITNARQIQFGLRLHW